MPRAVLLGVGALVGAWRFTASQDATLTQQVNTRSQRRSRIRHFDVPCDLLQVRNTPVVLRPMRYLTIHQSKVQSYKQ